MRKHGRFAAALLLALGVAGCGGAASGSNETAHNGLRLVQVGKFDQPVDVLGAPGAPHLLFIVEKTGEIAVVRSGHVLKQPFLDIRKLVGTSYIEQGLLGLAFSPGYAQDGLFYVDYTMPDNDIRIAEYQRSSKNAARANPASAKVVLTIDHHQFQNHNGGDIAFGPDGDLYIGVGDGGSEEDPDNNGQNTDTLLGKMLRISPRPGGGYSIPPGNPFVGKPDTRPEIWAYGLRNPWRFSFDAKNGALIIADVGQNLQEEIDYAAKGAGAGANYGWSVWEGERRNRRGVAPHAVFPVLIALHSHGYCAIIGGYVVRDPTLRKLYGRYLFGDNCRSQIMAATLSPGHATRVAATGLEVSATSAFGQDDADHVYIASLNGPVYRLTGR
ncbi:MAG TPA: PQQ-dependent sugar dehydrogenase [Solirubrobacteraceae bacterium]|jgi:glucose/arabinose dehydrogenase|nr:PQQ-dependent sugar dehydrogenase [Solirubrobacteraceae bacterium]